MTINLEGFFAAKKVLCQNKISAAEIIVNLFRMGCEWMDEAREEHWVKFPIVKEQTLFQVSK